MRGSRKILPITILLCTLLFAAPPAVHADDDDGKVYVAKMTGMAEVPDPVNTAATGFTVFATGEYEQAIVFRMRIDNASGILSDVGAHIHCGAAGQNGPVVAFLAQPVPGGYNGTVVLNGAIFSTDIIDASCGATLPELLDSMQAGNTYVNVHSEAYPGGEIRGQIFRLYFDD